MRKTITVGLLALGMIGLLSALAFSAPPPQAESVEINANVKPAMGLTIDDGGDGINLEGDPAVGGSPTDALTATVRANWDWQLAVNAVSFSNVSNPGDPVYGDFTGSTFDGENITLDAIDASNNVVGSTDLATAATLASGAKTDGTDFTMQYTLSVDWLDEPGEFQGTQDYTATFQ